MLPTTRLWTTLAALGGFLAIAVGAFAAHAVGDPQAKDWLRLGAQYGFMHSLAVFAAVFVIERGARLARFAPGLFLLGQVFFCGSLYGMALGGPRVLGAITPIGGLLFLAGWALLALACARARTPQA